MYLLLMEIINLIEVKNSLYFIGDEKQILLSKENFDDINSSHVVINNEVSLKVVKSNINLEELDNILKNQEHQHTVDRTPVLPQILPTVPRKENIVKEDLNTNSEDNLNKQILSEYNELIRSKIKQYAIRNYPTKSIKRGQEGTVFLKFILNENGYLTDIKIGDKTEASIALINAAKDSIEKNSPYKFDQKLKKKNEFSIVIVYKID